MLPDIYTSRLDLLPWKEGDLAELHELWQNPEVRKYLFGGQEVLEDRAKRILKLGLTAARNERLGYWTIRQKLKQSLIGCCGFHSIEDTRSIELLYALEPSYWGRGLAYEACCSALSWVWSSTNFRAVYARTHMQNVRSIALMRRLGMQLHSLNGYRLTFLLERPRDKAIYQTTLSSNKEES